MLNIKIFGKSIRKVYLRKILHGFYLSNYTKNINIYNNTRNKKVNLKDVHYTQKKVTFKTPKTKFSMFKNRQVSTTPWPSSGFYYNNVRHKY